MTNASYFIGKSRDGVHLAFFYYNDPKDPAHEERLAGAARTTIIESGVIGPEVNSSVAISRAREMNGRNYLPATIEKVVSLKLK